MANLKRFHLTGKSLKLDSGHLVPYSEKTVKKLSATSRFGSKYTLYKETADGLLVPRNLMDDTENDQRTEGLSVQFQSTFKPRSEEQARVVEECSNLLLAGESHVVSAPTGFGKTICCMEIIHRVGKVPLVVAIKEDIRDQWIMAAKTILGLEEHEIGLVQGTKCQIKGKKLIIGMIQSLAKQGKFHPDIFEDIGFVIWDETHRVGADQFSQTPWLFRGKLRLGVSATPDRKDGRDSLIHAHIGPVRVTTEAMPMIPKVLMWKSKWKVPARPMKTSLGFRVRQIPHSAGKTMHIIKIMANNQERNAQIAKFANSAHKAGRLTVIFADTKKHLENIEEELLKSGVPGTDIAYYIGGMKEQEREAAKVKPILLSTYMFVSEGTDIPWLDTCILGTPRSDVVQIVGRVIRQYPDKKQPVVFDVWDTDSKVFRGYGEKRLEWYKSIGAEVKHIS